MRVKTGIVRHRKHKKVLDRAKGSWQGNNRRFKLAKQVELHAGEYAFAGRKMRKRDFRSLWIQRINAATRALGMDYREFMHALKQVHITLNRKMLADLAVNHTDAFAQIVAKVK